MNRTYEAEEGDLLEGVEHIIRPLHRRHLALVLVDELDEKTLHAIQYALTIRPEEVRAVHLGMDEGSTETLRSQWRRRGIPLALHAVPCGTADRGGCLAGYVREEADGDVQVTVVVPGPARQWFAQRLRRGRSWTGLVHPLRGMENVCVTVMREHGGAGHHTAGDRIRVSPRSRHIAVILVGRLDRSVLKAIRYARQIEAIDIRAVHAGIDPQQSADLATEWAEVGTVLGIPLDVEECFDRNIGRTIRDYVDRLKAPDAEVTVILPRREYPRVTQRLLHDRTSRTIARALLDEPHVDVVAVPYQLRWSAADARRARPDREGAETVR